MLSGWNFTKTKPLTSPNKSWYIYSIELFPMQTISRRGEDFFSIQCEPTISYTKAIKRKHFWTSTQTTWWRPECLVWIWFLHMVQIRSIFLMIHQAMVTVQVHLDLHYIQYNHYIKAVLIGYLCSGEGDSWWEWFRTGSHWGSYSAISTYPHTS